MSKGKQLFLTSKRLLNNVRDILLVVKYNASRIFWKESTDSVQIFIAMSSFTWAILLFISGDSFEVNPTYHIMSHFGSEVVWASLFLIQGFAGGYRVLLQKNNLLLLLLDLVLGCILWTGSSISVLFSVYPLPSGIASALISAWFSWWLLIRLPLDK